MRVLEGSLVVQGLKVVKCWQEYQEVMKFIREWRRLYGKVSRCNRELSLTRG